MLNKEKIEEIKELYLNKCPYCGGKNIIIKKHNRKENYDIECTNDNCEKHISTLPISIYNEIYNREEILLDCGAKIIKQDDEKLDYAYSIIIIDIDGKEIFGNTWAKKEWDSCSGYIKYKLEKLLGEDSVALSKPYVMLSIYGRMYRMSDLEYNDNYRCLKRSMTPIGYYTEESEVHNLITLGWLYSISTYKENELVLLYDTYYLNGKIVATLDEIMKKFNVTRYGAENNYKCSIEDIAKYIYQKTGEKSYDYDLCHMCSGSINSDIYVSKIF